MISCSKVDDNHSPYEITCNSLSKVIAEEDFNAISTSNYNITNIQLNGNCLEVTISSSGCDPEPWEMNLYSTDTFYTVYPLERAVKVELINEQLCEALFQKSISFDLTPFQLDAQNEIPLHIEGWDEPIIYEY